jgi:hypothetical protein
MASSAVTEEQPLDGCIAVIGRWAWLLPSLSDAAFLLPIAVFFSCTTGVKWLLSDSDTGWHIRTGEWILKNGRVPSTDLFSFTKNGQPWFAWEWLSDLAMGWLHSHGGLPAIVFASFVILCTTSLVLYRAAAAESGHRLVSFLLTWLAMGAATMHWLARPHLITPLIAALFCWALNRVERGFKHSTLVALPALTVLWVNLHGGFFVGIVLVLTYSVATAGEHVLHFGRHDGWGRARLYALTAGACVLASLMNPYGYHLHAHVLEYLGSPFYLQYVSEFRPVDFQWRSASYFETLLVLAVSAALWHLGKARLVHVLLPLSWTHLALLSARNVPIFAVVTLPSIAVAISEWIGFAQHRWQANRVGAAAQAVADIESDLNGIAGKTRVRVALVPVMGMIVVGMMLTHPGQMSELRAEFDPTQFPVEAASVINHNSGSATRLFCSWQWGGYLIYRLWPSIQVFNDGRTDFYGPDFVHQGLALWTASSDWANILDRYRVNEVLLPVDSALASVLRERGDWKPVYQDRVAVLFEKREDVR